MDRLKIINSLREIEKMYPVNSWKMNEICVWPFVKFYVFSQIFKREFSEEDKVKSSKINQFFLFVKSFYFFIRLMLKRPRKKNYILFSGANNYRVDYRYKFINRFFYPLQKRLKSVERDYIIVDFDRKLKGKDYDDHSHLYFLKDYTYFTWFYNNYLFRNKIEYNLDGIDEVLEEMNVCFNMNLSKKTLTKLLIRKVRELNNYAYIYNIFIKKFNVQLCCGLCYYSLPMHAMHYICNSIKIPSIDFQHGAQGSEHIAYSGFYSKYGENLMLLPKYFWVWDESSAHNLEKWIHQYGKKVIRGGNPWLNYLLKMDDAEFSNYEKKKIVLYTMQFEFLDRVILETIKSLDESFVWWIRVHPRKRHVIPKLKEQLKEEGVEFKVNIDDATNLPLITILKHTYVHVSKFSGSIIEAEQCDVPSIIIDVVGKEIFKDYLDNGRSYFLENFNNYDLESTIININELLSDRKLLKGDLWDSDMVFNDLLKNN